MPFPHWSCHTCLFAGVSSPSIIRMALLPSPLPTRCGGTRYPAAAVPAWRPRPGAGAPVPQPSRLLHTSSPSSAALVEPEPRGYCGLFHFFPWPPLCDVYGRLYLFSWPFVGKTFAIFHYFGYMVAMITTWGYLKHYSSSACPLKCKQPLLWHHLAEDFYKSLHTSGL